MVIVVAVRLQMLALKWPYARDPVQFSSDLDLSQGPRPPHNNYGQRHGADFCKLWRPIKRKRGQTGGLLAFPVTNVTEPFQYSRWLQRAGFSIPMNPTYPLSGGAWTVASVARALKDSV